MIESDWYGLYNEGWKGQIVEDSFAHPAKFSSALIRYIYQHLIDDGLLHRGDTVVDPFGGVALGGLDAIARGLHWIGVELEPKFVELGNRNIDKWMRETGLLANRGSARLIQGDSRELSDVIQQAEIVVSSPPYSQSPINPGNVGNAIKQVWGTGGHLGRNHEDGYGTSPGQLGSMHEGDVDAIISSPPFAEAQSGGGIVNTGTPHEGKNSKGGGYRSDMQATTEGNLATLKADESGFDAIVSSPPFENGSPHNGGAAAFIDDKRLFGDYGEHPDQLGNSTGETFWTAARDIVIQCHSILKTNGHAVWVVKHFVRNGELVDFPAQWMRLCESIGFKTIHLHRAWVIQESTGQLSFDGEIQTKVTERKSFFRRLAEKKGSPRIDFETVLCMTKT